MIKHIITQVITILVIGLPSSLCAIDLTLLPNIELEKSFKDYQLRTATNSIFSSSVHKAETFNYVENFSDISYRIEFDTDHLVTISLGSQYYHMGGVDRLMHQSNFVDLGLQIGATSYLIDSIAITGCVGVFPNINRFDLVHNTLYTLTSWIHFIRNESVDIYLGFTAQTGAKSSFFLPVIGFETQIDLDTRVEMMFPGQISYKKRLMDHVDFSATYRGFGGWYEHYHRLTEENPLASGYVSYFSSGLDAGLGYDDDWIQASGYVGLNLGGFYKFLNSSGDHLESFSISRAWYLGSSIGYCF